MFSEKPHKINWKKVRHMVRKLDEIENKQKLEKIPRVYIGKNSQNGEILCLIKLKIDDLKKVT